MTRPDIAFVLPLEFSNVMREAINYASNEQRRAACRGSDMIEVSVRRHGVMQWGEAWQMVQESLFRVNSIASAQGLGHVCGHVRGNVGGNVG